jgi:hypothetical protein
MAKLNNHPQLKQRLIFGNPAWKALSYGPLSETEQINVTLVTHGAFDDIVRGVGSPTANNSSKRAFTIN